MTNLWLPSIILGVLCAVAAVTYFSITYRKFGYIISPFNVPIFIMFGTLILIPVFATSDDAWKAIWIDDADEMSHYLAASANINLFGALLFFMVLVLLMALRKQNVQAPARGRLATFLKTVESINPRVINLACILCIVTFLSCCIIFNDGTFPLLNGKRSFYYETAISPFYQAANACLAALALYYGFTTIRHRKGVGWLAAIVVCQLLSASRGSLLTDTLAPIGVFALSFTNDESKRKKTVRRNSGILLPALLLIVLLLGLEIQSVRSGGGIGDASDLLNEFANGNTFSDVRDGALILRGFDEQYNGVPIMGLTYLAGLLTFIPASLSPLRQAWSWGRFTANSLVGLETVHFGFRGGWFMEAYVNFDIVGIIITAILLALLLYWMEGQYQSKLLMSQSNDATKIVLVLAVAKMAFASLICTTSVIELYSTLALIFFLLAASWAAKVFRDKRASSAN